MMAGALAWISSNRLAAGLISASLFVAAIGGAYAKGRLDEGHKRDVAAALEREKLATRNATANGAAAVQAEKDGAIVASKTESLKHADDKIQDGAPSASRVALACERLRQQGADLSRVPACGGSQGRAEAGPRR